MKRTETKIDVTIIADEGMELFNGEHATNRVSAPIGVDLSEWVEREKITEETTE